jgi:hypothetical protein
MRRFRLVFLFLFLCAALFGATVLLVGAKEKKPPGGMVRHDENFWDYSLLANPFNPAAPPANAPANFTPIVNNPSNLVGTSILGISPHYYNTRRNLENFGLTLLPDSKIRFRLGYNHNTNSGPSFNAIPP